MRLARAAGRRVHVLHVTTGEEMALRRAARDADGWFGLTRDVESATVLVTRLHQLRREAGKAYIPAATAALPHGCAQNGRAHPRVK